MLSYDTIGVILVGLFLYIYWRLKKNFSYFEKNGIPYIKPESWIFGNMLNEFWYRKPFGIVFLDYHRQLAPHRFGGMFEFQKPGFIIRDAELLNNIFIKDFDYFQNHHNLPPTDDDLFSLNLSNLKGEKWKNLRIKLSGAFTSSKIKMMFPLVNECAQKLNKVLNDMPEEAFNVKDLSARYTTDAIGSCVFGIETRCLENPDNEFRAMAKRIIRFRFKLLIPMIWPKIPTKLIKMFNLTVLDEKEQELFKRIAEEAIKYREENNIQRNDLLDILIALKNNTTIEKYRDSGDKEDLEKILALVGDKVIKGDVEMTLSLLGAQLFVFFIAGLESTSSTLGFMLLELAKNQDIQNKVREEILYLLDVCNGQVNDDFLKQMTYSDMVIAETLRKYPPTAAITRECTKSYKIPDSNVVIPASSPVFISQIGIHNDERYYEKPDEFFPEHFTEKAKANRPSQAYIPFGDGPRICIAERFSKVLIKVGLIHMLKDSIYRVSPKMKLPVEFESNLGLLSVQGGIWLLRERL